MKLFKALVLGDSCLDVFSQCHIKICPEAPVLAVQPFESVTKPGMAGNVQKMLKDYASGRPSKIDLITNTEKIIKTRYIDDTSNYIMFRVDDNDKVENPLKIRQLTNKLNKYDVILLADYNKGFLTEEVMQYVFENHPFTILDTKKEISPWAAKCKFIKINEKEYNFNLQKSKILLKKSFEKKLIVTRGKNGATYMNKCFPTQAINLRDCSGAGDLVSAVLAYEIWNTGNIEKAIQEAVNKATIFCSNNTHSH